MEAISSAQATTNPTQLKSFLGLFFIKLIWHTLSIVQILKEFEFAKTDHYWLCPSSSWPGKKCYPCLRCVPIWPRSSAVTQIYKWRRESRALALASSHLLLHETPAHVLMPGRLYWWWAFLFILLQQLY